MTDTALATATVVWRARAVGQDADDPSGLPDEYPLAGVKVRLIPSPRKIEVAAPPGGVAPTTYTLRTWDLVTSADGSLVNLEDAGEGIQIVASDAIDGVQIEWTSIIDAPDSGVPAISKVWLAPAGSTVDLTTVVSIPPSPGTLAEYLQSVRDARAARDIAVASGAVASAAAEAAAADAERAEQAAQEATAPAQEMVDAAVSPVVSAVKVGEGWWSSTFPALALDDQPIVSVSVASAIAQAAVVGASTDMVYDSHFRYDNVTALGDRGSGYVNSTVTPGIIVPEFVTDPENNELELLYRAYGAEFRVRVEVDGIPHQLPLQGPFAVTDRSYLYVRLQFPTARSRHLKIYASGQDEFGGVRVAPGQGVRRPAGEVGKRLVVVADSYAAGGPGVYPDNPTRLETFVYFLGKLLGCDSIVNLGIGGTGWANPNGALGTFLDRTPQALSLNPHVLAFVGSRNDVPAVLSGIGLTVGDVIANALAGVEMASSVPVVVIGGPVTNPGTQVDQVHAALRSAATMSGVPYIDLRGTEGTPSGGHATFERTQLIARTLYAGLDRADCDARVIAARSARLATTVTLTAMPPAAATVGAAVTLTASLGVHLAGRVAYFADGVLVGYASVVSGVATMSVTLPEGDYVLSARFEPADPGAVKTIASNRLTYRVITNLGFRDTFSGSGAPTTTENGKAWAILAGDWAQVDGSVGATIATGNAVMLADAGTAHGAIEATMAGAYHAGAGIVFRAVDGSNNLYINWSGANQPTLWSRVSNVSTELGRGTGGAWAPGDVVRIDWDIDAQTVTVQKNGIVVLSVSGVTGYTTQTKAGLLISATASSAGARFSSIEYTSL